MPYCPLSLCLGFFFSSRLIVLVEVARVGEGVGLIRGRPVGEGSKLVGEGRACASRRRGKWRQGRLWVGAIKAGSRPCHHGVCHQGRFSVVSSRRVPSRPARVRVLEAGQWRINLASGPDSLQV